MEILAMTDGDVERVYQLGSEERSFIVREGSRFWSIAQLRRWVASQQDVLLVAREADEVVGFVLSQLHQPTGKATIENLYVQPQWREGGIGAKLLKGCIWRLKERGAQYVSLAVRLDNPEGIRYFTRQGLAQGYDFAWFETFACLLF